MICPAQASEYQLSSLLPPTGHGPPVQSRGRPDPSPRQRTPVVWTGGGVKEAIFGRKDTPDLNKKGASRSDTNYLFPGTNALRTDVLVYSGSSRITIYPTPDPGSFIFAPKQSTAFYEHVWISTSAGPTESYNHSNWGGKGNLIRLRP